MDLKSVNLEHWWKVMAVAGGLLMVASAPAQFLPGVWLGLGLLLFGVGEWINHPLQTRIYEAGFQTTGYPRRWNLGGFMLNVLGAAAIAYGVYKLL